MELTNLIDAVQEIWWRSASGQQNEEAAASLVEINAACEEFWNTQGRTEAQALAIVESYKKFRLEYSQHLESDLLDFSGMDEQLSHSSDTTSTTSEEEREIAQATMLSLADLKTVNAYKATLKSVSHISQSTRQSSDSTERHSSSDSSEEFTAQISEVFSAEQYQAYYDAISTAQRATTVSDSWQSHGVGAAVYQLQERDCRTSGTTDAMAGLEALVSQTMAEVEGLKPRQSLNLEAGDNGVSLIATARYGDTTEKFIETKVTTSKTSSYIDVVVKPSPGMTEFTPQQAAEHAALGYYNDQRAKYLHLSLPEFKAHVRHCVAYVDVNPHASLRHIEFCSALNKALLNLGFPAEAPLHEKKSTEQYDLTISRQAVKDHDHYDLIIERVPVAGTDLGLSSTSSTHGGSLVVDLLATPSSQESNRR